jgi:flagellar assembly protein FliH/type III secretion protein L
MLDRARADVAQIRADAARIARDEEIARVAAELLVHRIDDEQRVEREIDRTVDIAVLLAERLVGEALAIDPLRIVALATEALRETRGARRIRVEANSEDVPILAEALAALGDGIASVEASTELSRGSLVMHTEIGRVDARLEPQLRRLTDALRDTLRTAEANRSSERGARSRE